MGTNPKLANALITPIAYTDCGVGGIEEARRPLRDLVPVLLRMTQNLFLDAHTLRATSKEIFTHNTNDGSTK